MKVTHGLQNLNGEAVAHFEFELRTQQRREGGEEGRERVQLINTSTSATSLTRTAHPSRPR